MTQVQSVTVGGHPWVNTGGNGRARQVWVASWGTLLGAHARAVEVLVMPYRCLVNTWEGGKVTDEGMPFATLDEAQRYGARYLDGGR